MSNLTQRLKFVDASDAADCVQSGGWNADCLLGELPDRDDRTENQERIKLPSQLRCDFFLLSE
jgi:hypothetical protein